MKRLQSETVKRWSGRVLFLPLLLFWGFILSLIIVVGYQIIWLPLHK